MANTTLKDLSNLADKALQLAGALKTAIGSMKQAAAQALADSKAREVNQGDVDALAVKFTSINTALTDLATLVNAS